MEGRASKSRRNNHELASFALLSHNYKNHNSNSHQPKDKSNGQVKGL